MVVTSRNPLLAGGGTTTASTTTATSNGPPHRIVPILASSSSPSSSSSATVAHAPSLSSASSRLAGSGSLATLPAAVTTPSGHTAGATSTLPAGSNRSRLIFPRSHQQMSELSDSSHSGVVSPATSLIENFQKKTGANVSPSAITSSLSAIATPTLNGVGGSASSNLGGGGSGGGGASTALSLSNGKQINTSSSSSLKETSSSSSTSQKVVNSSSSSTTTRVEKKSQRLHHHITSSSTSSSSSEMKTAALKRDLNEIKNSMSEINDLAMGRTNSSAIASIGGGGSSHLHNNTNLNSQNNSLLTTTTSTASSANVSASSSSSSTTTTTSGGKALTMNSPHSLNDLTKLNGLSGADAIKELKKKIRSSIENLVDDDSEPLVTFPDGDDDNMPNCMDLVNASKSQLSANGLSGSSNIVDTVKFEEKRTKTESKTKVVTDGYSAEEAHSNSAEMKRLQTGDIDYQEAKAAAAVQKRLEVDGIKTEENAAVIQEALSLRTGDITQQASNNVAAASLKVQSDTFSADKKAISQSQQSQTMTTNGGIISQEKHTSSATQSNYTMTHKGVSSTGSSMISSSQMSAIKLTDLKLDDLKALTSASGHVEIEQAISKYSDVLTRFVDKLQDGKEPVPDKSLYLEKINEVMQRAWAVPTHGHELGYSLCNSLRNSGGLDLLMQNCLHNDREIKFSSAQLLEQCLTTENRDHVVDHGLDKVVNVACACTNNQGMRQSRVGTGILEHLFKHSEGTCSDVIKLGGLEAVLFECRTNDVETLRHCASALANLSLYGGAENQEAMIYRKVPMWLFPLAFHDDDNIKYYACLAIAVLVANKEIEAEVLKSGCLDLVEPFVMARDPSVFAKSNLAHAHGQSKHWLQRLVPVLSSNREEARSLAAFHFCMEAGIKHEQGNTKIFHEIGAVEALKTVASCPDGIASKFAAQALRLIGETVPHKLSQQVPLWSVEDVLEWVKQIGFGEHVKDFADSQVDGDLLLKLNKDNLRNDIGITNGIRLFKFERDLQNLKQKADYSSRDNENMHQFLSTIGPEYCTYTYAMLHAGIDMSTLPQLDDDMLIDECGINKRIHRLRILNAVKSLETLLPKEESLAKTLDVFVSYRRSNGSQLASLLKVHLQLRGFSVFIDVERLEAGKFDNGLLNSIRQAKNFVLVLTPNALERCVHDDDGKDWVHREIVAALNANCNIIPIIDTHFKWPDTEHLPEDMRSVCHFNGVSWIHDYQDACIDKLERFMRGEKILDRLVLGPSTPGCGPATYQRMHSSDSEYQGSVASSCGGVGGSTGGISNGGASVNGVGGGSGGAGQVNNQANRYRQSASPARQRIGNAAGNGSGGGGIYGSSGQLSIFGGRAGSKRNLLSPYRTQQAPPKAISGSMQNMSPLNYLPPRRSSAVGIGGGGGSAGTSPHSGRSAYGHVGRAGSGSNKASSRSHSVDGLLDNKEGTRNSADRRVAEMAAMVAAGSQALTIGSSTSTLQPMGDYDCSMGSLAELQDVADDVDDVASTVSRREKPTHLAPPSAQHRKSRSLDRFLDEKTLAAIVVAVEPSDGTQSMHNLAIPVTPEVEGRGDMPPPLSPTSPTFSNTASLPRHAEQRHSKSKAPERPAASYMTASRPPIQLAASTRQSPEGVSSAEDDREEVKSRMPQLRKSTHSSSDTAMPVSRSSGIGGSGGGAKSQTRASAHLHRGSQQNNSKASSAMNSNNSNSTPSAIGVGNANGGNGTGSGSNNNNKTIFNRTMKKVRSLMKKP